MPLAAAIIKGYNSLPTILVEGLIALDDVDEIVIVADLLSALGMLGLAPHRSVELELVRTNKQSIRQ